MKKIIILSSDTVHHRYFFNKLIKKGVLIDSIIFETTHVKPPFDTGPLFEAEEKGFEKENFFSDVSYSLEGFNIFQFENVNSESSEELIRKINPDLGIVFGTRKIQSHIISLFPDGLINVHRGIAQLYRGLDSDLWAIYHGDYNNIGVTIHMIENRLDTGNIIYQETMPIKKKMKTFQIRYYTSIIATNLILKSIEDYFSGSFKTYPQKSLGRYYSFMPIQIKKIVNKKFNRYCNSL